MIRAHRLVILLLATSAPALARDGSVAIPVDGMHATFSPTGLEVTGRDGGAETWTLGLSLEGWGRGCSITPITRGVCESDGGRVEIRRAGLTEWYLDDERGLEQGFTIDAAPFGRSGHDEGPLRIVLSVRGGFEIDVAPGAVDALFTHEASGARVAYTGLRAWDAAGTELVAAFERDGDRLSIEVEDARAAYPVTIDPWIWTEEAKLAAGDAAAADVFGISVALSGDTAVVGACWDDDAGTDSGSAYVYVRSGTSWSQQAKLTSADAAGGDLFGRSVSIDGDTVLIGVQADDDAGSASGSSYVFVRSGTTWSQQAKLTASDAAGSDFFGVQVTVDGATALIGASGDDDAGGDSGSAYVFVRSGTSWTQQAKLTASDASGADRFGISVSLDGDTALVGAFHEDNGGGIDAGSAYAFTRTGTTWSQQQKITAPDGTTADLFGCSVSADGDRALIGALGDDLGGGVRSGSAYVFRRSGTTWSQEQKLSTPEASTHDQYGGSVSLEDDVALIGSYHGDGNATDSGAAYVYQRLGSTWIQEAKVYASDGATDDEFAIYVALSGDTALLGAPGDDDAGGSSGSAYAFVRSCSAQLASETTRLGTPPNPNAYLPGLTTGPIIGATWDPIVTSFHPGAFLDFVAVDLAGPLNIPTAMGTLLITPPPGGQIFYNFSPATAFALAVPYDCGLSGLSAWTQAGSVSAGPTIAFANAIDIVFGTY